MDFHWIDNGLKMLNLKLDLEFDELPFVVRDNLPSASSLEAGNNDISVQNLMKGMVLLLKTKDIDKGIQKSDPTGNWSTKIGVYPGNSVLSQRTQINSKTFSVEDYLKLSVDDSVPDAAKIWDDTYVEGGFTHYITKDGKTFSAEEGKLQNYPFHEVAKVIRWVFQMPFTAPRECISVYVLYRDAQNLFNCYFPIKGPRFHKPTNPSYIRGRLLVPSADTLTINQADGSVHFEHLACAELKGLICNPITRNFIARRIFLKVSSSEANKISRIICKEGDSSEKFNKLKRKDGTTISEFSKE